MTNTLDTQLLQLTKILDEKGLFVDINKKYRPFQCESSEVTVLNPSDDAFNLHKPALCKPVIKEKNNYSGAVVRKYVPFFILDTWIKNQTCFISDIEDIINSAMIDLTKEMGNLEYRNIFVMKHPSSGYFRLMEHLAGLEIRFHISAQ